MRSKQYIKLAISVLLIGLLVGCQTTIPLDFGDNTPRIVINAVATTQEGIEISLSESEPTGVVTPSTHIYYPYDHPNTPYKTTLHVNNKIIPVNEIVNYKPKSGDQIGISVEKSGLKTASAITTVPTSPTVGEMRVKKLDATRRGSFASNAMDVHLESGQSLELVDFELSIPILQTTKESYYRIIVEQQPVRSGERLRQDEYAWSQEQLNDSLLTQFASGDLIFDSSASYPMNLLAGSNLPSSDYRLTSTLTYATKVVNKDGSIDQGFNDQQISDYVALRVTVYAISADLYHYWHTLTSASFNKMGDFGLSEPVLIYNNIYDGLGILGSLTASKTQTCRIYTKKRSTD